MSVKRWLNDREMFLDNQGNPLQYGQLFFYVAQSVGTRQNTYSDSAGLIANSNPIVLDAFGRPQVEIWLTTGVMYKVILAATGDGGPVTDPVSPYWTEDNISGINDTSTVVSEWQVGPAPTFISTNSFSLVGDQTSTFTLGRRLKIVDGGGTKYGTITGSAFTTLTTITMSMDGGVNLVNPVSSVYYGIVDPANSSVGPDAINKKGNSVASAATTNIWATNGNEIHITGSAGPITSFGTAPYAGARRTLIFDSTPTITYNAATMQLPGNKSIIAAVGERWEVVADTTANMNVVNVMKGLGGYSPSLLPLNFIEGFSIVVNTTTSFSISNGQAVDSNNQYNITGASLTKTQAAWAAGTNAGGKLSAAAMANNTWYYWWALLNDADGTVDYGFDVSAASPTFPAGYTVTRYIGARKTALAATTWEPMVQHGDLVLFSTPPALDVSGVVSNANRTLTTVNIPAIRVEWFGNVVAEATAGLNASLYLTDPSVADVAAGTTGTPLSSIHISNTTAGLLRAGAQARCWSNTASQIGMRANNSNNFFVQTLGFWDPRGKRVS